MYYQVMVENGIKLERWKERSMLCMRPWKRRVSNGLKRSIVGDSERPKKSKVVIQIEG